MRPRPATQAFWIWLSAVLRASSGITAEQVRHSARKLLSAFKVPTVWLLVDSDDVIPRGSTGKVDAGRLRRLLAGEASRAQRFGE